ncbi:MAG: lycopene beta-cyclase CrtY [Myxococcales bacterium]|nr:lycopene beta-cyclase CrtY [Myxococcales bacterium]
MTERFDVVLVGAGLANAMTALALAKLRPGVRVALVERKPALDFEQTFCFHGSDVDAVPRAWSWLEPVVSHSWAGYDVRFPAYERSFSSAYHCIAGQPLATRLEETVRAMGGRSFLGCDVTHASDRRVLLADGRVVEGEVVLDGRGAEAPAQGTGYQKFVGWEVELDHGSAPLPHRPLLMDARVDQVDGYRFMYVLPFGEARALLEDTYFSSTGLLREADIEARMTAYLQAAGWRLRRIVRKEKGVLPMPWVENPLRPRADAAIEVGYRGGFFQAATGYSLPAAVRVAQAVADAEALSQPSVRAALAPVRRRLVARNRFYRTLNRLSFRGVHDHDRCAVFERFYRLPAPLIERFYAGESSIWDRVRIIGGRPPVPLSRFTLGRLMRVMEEAS